MQISVQVEGEIALIARFSRMREDVQSKTKLIITALAIKLQRHVVQDKLSGNPLHRRSGDLSRSVTWRLEDNDMTGVVGANTPYAARQEYGFTGTETVRSFVRRNQKQMVTAKRNKLGYETRPSLAKAAGTGDVTVRSFSRQVNYPAHSYLRSALEDMQSEIKKSIEEAVHEGLKP